MNGLGLHGQELLVSKFSEEWLGNAVWKAVANLELTAQCMPKETHKVARLCWSHASREGKLMRQHLIYRLRISRFMVAHFVLRTY